MTGSEILYFNGEPEPAADSLRTWTDYISSFKVQAALLAIVRDKGHLRKENGVKIAVPLSKVSQDDLAFLVTTGDQAQDRRRSQRP